MNQRKKKGEEDRESRREVEGMDRISIFIYFFLGFLFPFDFFIQIENTVALKNPGITSHPLITDDPAVALKNDNVDKNGGLLA